MGLCRCHSEARKKICGLRSGAGTTAKTVNNNCSRFPMAATFIVLSMFFPADNVQTKKLKPDPRIPCPPAFSCATPRKISSFHPLFLCFPERAKSPSGPARLPRGPPIITRHLQLHPPLRRTHTLLPRPPMATQRTDAALGRPPVRRPEGSIRRLLG